MQENKKFKYEEGFSQLDYKGQSYLLGIQQALLFALQNNQLHQPQHDTEEDKKNETIAENLENK